MNIADQFPCATRVNVSCRSCGRAISEPSQDCPLCGGKTRCYSHMVIAAQDEQDLFKRLGVVKVSCGTGNPDWARLLDVGRQIAEAMEVAINMWPESLLNILSNPRVRYVNLHDNRLAGAVVDPDRYSDSRRSGTDDIIFGPDGRKLVFGTLHLGGNGVVSYGSACVVLRGTDGTHIGSSTAFLERNSISFVSAKGPAVRMDVPPGSRALWHSAPALAVLKHERDFRSRNTWSLEELGGVVTRSNGVKSSDEFIEAQIAQDLTAANIASIRISEDNYEYRGRGTGIIGELADLSAALTQAVLLQARFAGISVDGPAGAGGGSSGPRLSST